MKTEGIDVRYVADLARIELTPEEEQLFQNQIGQIVDYVQKLQEADVSSVPDTPVDPHLPTNVLRADAVRPSFDAATALSNAPKQCDNLLIMPKIVE